MSCSYIKAWHILCLLIEFYFLCENKFGMERLVLDNLDDKESKFCLNAIIASVDALSRLELDSYFVYDVTKGRILYRSKNLIGLDMLEQSHDTTDMHNLYWDLIPNEVLKKMQLIDEASLEQWKLLSDETLQNLLLIKGICQAEIKRLQREYLIGYVCIIDYPIRLNGHEFYVTQKFSPLVLNSDGALMVGLIKIGLSTRREMSSFILCKKGRQFYFDFDKEKFVEFDISDKKLTPAEIAVLNRAEQGMTNEEIADDLFVSINTVKTHRQRIFKKLGVKTLSEAITVVNNYHTI